MSTTQQAEVQRSARPQAARPYARAALVLAAAVVFQLAFIASFAGVLPTNGAMGLVRGIAYFDGNQIARPLLVLSIYAGVSLVTCLGLALRRARAAAAAAPPVPAAGSGPVPVQLRQQAAVPAGASR
jgi:hypothetical protein